MLKQVVVTGSLAFDQIANFPGRFADHIDAKKLHILNISFLVETLRVERGGTGGNMAYTLALLGTRPRLVAAIGGDGEAYEKDLARVGVNVSGVRAFAKERTAMGFVVTDKDDNQIWAFYGGAMRRTSEVKLIGLTPESLVIIGPSDPKAVVEYVRTCRLHKWPYLYDPAFQLPQYSRAQLRSGVLGAQIVVGNDYEIAQLKRLGSITKTELISRERVVVTTLGDKGSRIERGRKTWHIPAVKVRQAIDPTGAGDAYRAGLVAGFLRNLPLDVCGRMGSLAAAYTVEKYGTQTHRFTLEEFKRRYRENFGERLPI
ncbi:MAG: carbohydrate kinase family protein [Candidatus Chisholmbacteria bacterium]|nr:carbohydrate kinase family protein [Candidatus Chisholmbacteria bacterium]